MTEPPTQPDDLTSWTPTEKTSISHVELQTSAGHQSMSAAPVEMVGPNTSTDGSVDVSLSSGEATSPSEDEPSADSSERPEPGPEEELSFTAEPTATLAAVDGGAVDGGAVADPPGGGEAAAGGAGEGPEVEPEARFTDLAARVAAATTAERSRDIGPPPSLTPPTDLGEPAGLEPSAGSAGSAGSEEQVEPDAVPLGAVGGALVDGGPGSGAEGGAGPAGAAGEGEPVQPELDELADPERLRGAVEAVLLVVDTPTSSVTLAQVLGRSVPEVVTVLETLRDDYDAGGRGMDLREVAGGWRLYSRDEFAGYVERFILDGQQARLTQAALETLAVIAYRQPVTRSRISGIRGVSVDAVMRTLLTRGLVEECGADPDTGGGLYRTTQLFLEKMGLRSLEELPSLAPLLPDTSQLDDVELST